MMFRIFPPGNKYCGYATPTCLNFSNNSILTVRKVGHLNIKTKMFDFEARILIGWLADILASEPIRTRASMSNMLVFMLRSPIFLTASIVF